MTVTTSTRYRVLVVDDNRDAATSVSDLFDLAGFEVRTCYDGASAIEAVEEFTPDACVLDITMPGMNGYELARRLRTRFPDQPPVFATLTAHGDYSHLEQAADAGFDLHFTKPAAPQDVIEQLTEALRAVPPESQARHCREGVLKSLLNRLTGLFTRTRSGV